ncbi:hypothetical protein OROMI_029028 [Orobanche minor]
MIPRRFPGRLFPRAHGESSILNYSREIQTKLRNALFNEVPFPLSFLVGWLPFDIQLKLVEGNPDEVVSARTALFTKHTL